MEQQGQAGTKASSTTTAGVTVWQGSVANYQKFRCSITGYSAGTVTCTGTASPIPYTAISSDVSNGSATSTGAVALVDTWQQKSNWWRDPNQSKTDTTVRTSLAAPGAGVTGCITSWAFENTNATTDAEIELLEDPAGTPVVIWGPIRVPFAGANHNPNQTPPICTAANKAVGWRAKAGVTTVWGSLAGHKTTE